MSKKSFLTYLSCILLLILFVNLKQHSITKKNQKPAISFYSAWPREGKPVLAQKAEKNDLQTFWKMTLALENDHTYVGYVPKAVKRSLCSTSPVTIHFHGKNIEASILEIGCSPTPKTGMYAVRIACKEPLGGKEEKYLGEVATSEKKSCLLLPHAAIHSENNAHFVWVIKENKAHKQLVTLGERNNKGMMAKGIDEEDLIVLSGAALQENDIVKITSGN